jgi:hypothetical protein
VEGVKNLTLTDEKINIILGITTGIVSAKAAHKVAFIRTKKEPANRLWDNCSAVHKPASELSATCTQVLDIQTLLYFTNRRPDFSVKSLLFFNFLNRMDGGSVVFAA